MADTITTFNSSGTFTPTETGVVEILVIGGGGGGGRNGGGGGGAGGVRFTTYAVTVNVGVTVTVGNGGAGAVDSNHPGSNGQDSSFGTVTATGGGGGGSRDTGGGGVAGGAGGGGGGAGGSNSNAFGAGTSGQGWNGGDGTALDLGVDAAGGGGGGGGAKGGSAGVAAASQVAGNGGSGSTYSITGSDVVYAGGGGGGRTTQNTTLGTGGSGGGGNGGGSSTAATNGTANKGGGGGGGGSGSTATPGDGGKGVVIVRRKDPVLSRASNTILSKGFQISTWMTTDDSGRAYLTAQDFTDHNLTNVTYYEDPLYNSTFHASATGALWGMSKAPYPANSSLGADPPSSDWFTSEQQANAANCVNVCFCDESAYSVNEANYAKNWFDNTHQYHSHVLCHFNQFVGQWSDADLDAFIETAHPDMLTFDNYIFDTDGHQADWKIPSFTIYNINLQHRDRALRGWDRTYTSPIIWGQYLLNFKPGHEQWVVEGTYTITESQKYLVAMTSIALGAKWLSLFLTEKQSEVWSITFTDGGTRTSHFTQYAELFRQIKNLGPHLIRLHSTGYATEPGDHMVTGTPTENSPVYNRFSANSKYFLKTIAAENLGTNNDELPGDVIVGYFDPLPGYDTTQFFTCTAPKYFMIVNGLTHGNGLTTANQHGALSETQQKITITFDMTGGDITKLRKVSRDTGSVVPVTLTFVSGTDYKLEVTLGGGEGELYFWEQTVAGSVCWGHDTGVTETNVRNFSGNWVGTGAIENTGDSERLALESGEYMESEIVNTGAVKIELIQGKYQAGNTTNMYYKTGDSVSSCEAASWVEYTGFFQSSGYIKIKFER